MREVRGEGLKADGVPAGYKRTEVGVIPEDWECDRLENYFSFISYGFTNPMPTVESGIFMITAADINSGRIQFETARKTTENAYKTLLSSKSKPRRNDLLLTKDGSLGRLAIVGDEQICINQSVAVIRPNEKVEPIFLKLLLESPFYQRKMLEDSGGSTIKHIYITIVNLMYVGLPSNLPEQRAIASALSDVDELLAALEQLIAKKRDLKQGAMQQLLTGKRRLPGFGEGKGYKETEVGMIPEDWRLATLGEICVFENGDRGSNYPSRKDFVFSGIPFINAGHINKGQVDHASMDYITQDSYDRLGGGKVKAGDILFCLRGSLGKFGIVKSDFGDGAIASSLVIIRLEHNSVFRKYLDCYFSSSLCERMIEAWSGGAAQPNLGAQDLAKFFMLLPPVAEQTAIATVLSDIDAEITALEQRHSKTRALKQGMMQQLLTGKTRLL